MDSESVGRHITRSQALFTLLNVPRMCLLYMLCRYYFWGPPSADDKRLRSTFDKYWAFGNCLLQITNIWGPPSEDNEYAQCTFLGIRTGIWGSVWQMTGILGLPSTGIQGLRSADNGKSGAHFMQVKKKNAFEVHLLQMMNN